MADGKLDLTDTIKDGARVVATDATLRQQLLMAFTEDSRLHVREVCVLASSFWTRTTQREDCGNEFASISSLSVSQNQYKL